MTPPSLLLLVLCLIFYLLCVLSLFAFVSLSRSSRLVCVCVCPCLCLCLVCVSAFMSTRPLPLCLHVDTSLVSRVDTSLPALTLCASCLCVPCLCDVFHYRIAFCPCVWCCLFVFVHVRLCAPSKCVKTILSLCQLIPSSNSRDVHHMTLVTKSCCVTCIM